MHAWSSRPATMILPGACAMLRAGQNHRVFFFFLKN
jgi:hypothetical protein